MPSYKFKINISSLQSCNELIKRCWISRGNIPPVFHAPRSINFLSQNDVIFLYDVTNNALEDGVPPEGSAAVFCSEIMKFKPDSYQISHTSYYNMVVKYVLRKDPVSLCDCFGSSGLISRIIVWLPAGPFCRNDLYRLLCRLLLRREDRWSAVWVHN